MNGPDTYVTYIGNSYLKEETKEKICIVVGEEFEDLYRHLLIIRKALYVLRTSGLLRNNICLIVCVSWISLLARLNRTFGCGTTRIMISTSIKKYIHMILQ